MRHWEIEGVAALAAEVDAKQKQAEKLAEVMLRLAKELDDLYDDGGVGHMAAVQIRNTIKDALGA